MSGRCGAVTELRVSGNDPLLIRCVNPAGHDNSHVVHVTLDEDPVSLFWRNLAANPWGSAQSEKRAP